MTTVLPQEFAPTNAATQPAPVRVVVPSDTHNYWVDALHRCGVFVVRGEATQGASAAFIPPESAIDDTELRAMHRAGLAIVGGGRVARVVRGAPNRRMRLRGIRGSGPLFAGCPTIRMPATIPATASLVAIDTEGPAPTIALPLPTASQLLAAAPALHEFPVTTAIDVHEFVSGCDHGGLRRLLRNALRLAHHLQDRTFATLGEVPRGYSGGLGIRIDADDFDPGATASVVRALVRADLRATWFIDVERHVAKDGADAVRALAARGDEVQNHFYHHYTYRSAARNQRNLARSRAVLRDWGIETTAAATPFGTFHAGVSTALAAEGIEWSSEFSANYDDLPTLTNDSIQVPVHPVCPILLLEAGLGIDAVHRYYTDRLQTHLNDRECVVFYGHPIRDLGAVPDLFAALRTTLTAHETETGQPVWQPTLGEFKTFHDERRKSLVDGALGDNAPSVRLDSPDRGQSPLPPEPSTCVAWQPNAPLTLANRQRNILFRRWLREFRNPANP